MKPKADSLKRSMFIELIKTKKEEDTTLNQYKE